jgi:ATP-dependent exoDNAse (exonuclease V) alpha subunit
MASLAITHFTAQIIGRGEGRSAVLSAAYRHCARIEHEGEARVVDYSNKRGLIHEEFVLPPDAPAWLRTLIADRSVAGAVESFWNKVEQSEKRADAQFAREFIIALPVELSVEQNITLMRNFVANQILGVWPEEGSPDRRERASASQSGGQDRLQALVGREE